MGRRVGAAPGSEPGAASRLKLILGEMVLPLIAPLALAASRYCRLSVRRDEAHRLEEPGAFARATDRQEEA